MQDTEKIKEVIRLEGDIETLEAIYKLVGHCELNIQHKVVDNERIINNVRFIEAEYHTIKGRLMNEIRGKQNELNNLKARM